MCPLVVDAALAFACEQKCQYDGHDCDIKSRSKTFLPSVSCLKALRPSKERRTVLAIAVETEKMTKDCRRNLECDQKVFNAYVIVHCVKRRDIAYRSGGPSW